MAKRDLPLLFQISTHQRCCEKTAIWGSAGEKEETFPTHRSGSAKKSAYWYSSMDICYGADRHCRAGGLLWSWALGEPGTSLQVGARMEHASAPGSKAAFRGWRICLSQAQAAQLPREANREQNLLEGRILKILGCNFSSAFWSTGQAHLYFSPGWQHL